SRRHVAVYLALMESSAGNAAVKCNPGARSEQITRVPLTFWRKGKRLVMEQVRAVRGIAPARLHLGFLDLNGGRGRHFGGFGLAIDQAVTKLVVERAPTFAVNGADVERCTQLLSRLAHLLALRSCYQAHVESSLPVHAGLGSGTQLTLALATGLIQLEGL